LGAPVDQSILRGKWTAVYFGYTFCPDVCPTTLNEVMKVYDGLSPDQQAKLAPIFITVDPARDTVEQMNQYVTSFSPALIGLTGSPEQIAAAEKGYHVYARKAGSEPNYTMDHTSILYLMDRNGKFLRHFNGDAPAQEIADGLKAALGS
jgi:cytochrome oxidase Cu insertion factor (SCO1/SenC/PrrC family)